MIPRNPIAFIVTVLSVVNGAVVDLTNANFDELVNNAEITMINFSADWCRFSQMLRPVFEEAASKFDDEPHTRIVMGRVDCDQNPDLAQRFSVNKYPTIKVFRNGQMAKREYRGQRSADALAEHMRSQLNSNIADFTNAQDLEGKIEGGKRKVIAYFAAPNGAAYDNFRKISSNLREECRFYLGIGAEFQVETQPTGSKINFRDIHKSGDEIEAFTGDANNYDYMNEWLTDKCIPLVREITFENAEELTEEGVPFLILFKKNEDEASLETFTQEVVRQLADQKSTINCLHADGKKFAHPLHHLGKSEADLPLLAIDSFRHMYLFPNMDELTVPGKLRQFVTDLHSGKLHREFHHGPDPVVEQQQIEQQQDGGEQPGVAPGGDGSGGTGPPESVFQRLQPSENRYTLLGRDEL